MDNKKTNYQIEGLRGISILIIVTFHLIYRYQQLFHGNDIKWMSWWGDFGVCIFLMISSYFLINEQTPMENKLRWLLSFYKKKIVRLWPMYFVSITITYCASFILPVPSRECDFFEYLFNIPFVNGFIGIPYVDGAHWYLTYLIAITAVVGIIRVVFPNKSIIPYLIWIALGVAVMGLFGVGIGRFIGGSYIGIACCGIALHKLTTTVENKKDALQWIAIIVISVLYTAFIKDIYVAFELIGAIAICEFVLKKKLFVLESTTLVKLGSVSYALYLTHQNIGYGIMIKLEHLFGGKYSMAFSLIALLFCFLLAFLLTYNKRKIKVKD